MRFARHIFSSAVLATIAVLSISAASSSAEGSSKIELGYHLEAGDSYLLKTTVENKTVISDPTTGDQTLRLVTETDYRTDVLDVDDDGISHLLMTIDRMAAAHELPDGMGAFDSAEGEESELDNPFVAMVGQAFEITMTPTGQILEVLGAKQMVENVLASAADEAVEQCLSLMFNEESLRESIEQSSAIYPAYPVAVGEEWEHGYKLSFGLPMNIGCQIKLVNATEETIELSMDCTIEPPEDLEPMSLEAAQINMPISGSLTGTFHMDRTSGWMSSGTMIGELTSHSTVITDDEQYDFSFIQHTTMTFEVEKL